MAVQSDFSYIGWLRSTGMEVPGGLTEEKCRLLSAPPAPESHVRRSATSALVIHHSASKDGSAAPFRVLHRGVFGWKDVGYHFIIGNGSLTGDGEIEDGRPEWAVGAHARGFNDASIGVCLVGNFEDAPPGARQKDSLRSLLAGLMTRHSISGDAVFLHREVKGCRTACPGGCFTRELLLKDILRY